VAKHSWRASANRQGRDVHVAHDGESRFDGLTHGFESFGPKLAVYGAVINLRNQFIQSLHFSSKNDGSQ
jgi:hypothetical protein